MSIKKWIKIIYSLVTVVVLSACSASSGGDYDYSGVAGAPKFISSSSIEVDENTLDVIILQVEADSDLVYGIDSGDDANIFNLDSLTGHLSFKIAVNTTYPKDTNGDSIYEVTVSATDTSGKKGTQSLHVKIVQKDKDEWVNPLLPHFISSPNLLVADGTIEVMRVEAENSDEVFYALSSGADKGQFYINKYTGELAFNKAVKYSVPADSNGDNTYEITVIATTSRNYQAKQDIKITVTDQKILPPVFVSNPINAVAENQYRAHQIKATGNGNIRYSIISSDDGSRFKIHSSDGELNFITRPNYLNPSDKNGDNRYELTIKASDATDSFTLQDVTIIVKQANENLSFASPNNINIIENKQLSFYVEAVGASGIVYNLNGSEDDDLFTLGATTGELLFKQIPKYDSPTDANKDNQYVITVKATSTSSKSITTNITVTITDKSNASINFTSQSTMNSTENRIKLFTAKAVGGTNIRYGIANEEDGAQFSIDQDSGELIFKQYPDFERPTDSDRNNLYIVTLTAINSVNESTRQEVRINIQDIAETTVPLLVVRVQYTNYKFDSSESVWSMKIFGTSHGELNDYYNEISYGKFRFTKARENYGAYDGVITVTLNQTLNRDYNKGQYDDIAKNALSLANPYIDFSKYDKDGNGKISRKELSILFINAGGENAASAHPGVWAHSKGIGDHWYNKYKLDGMRVMNEDYDGSFAVAGERYTDSKTGKLATIGLIAHELGHAVFRLPDLYDLDYSTAGIGYFGLMGFGSFGYNYGDYTIGMTPTHMTGWSKIKCGFVTPTIIDSSISNLAISDTTSVDYNLYKIPTGNTNEYFLIENRNNSGYDKGLNKLNGTGLFNGGILIMHIDDNVIENNQDTHRHVDVEEASMAELDRQEDKYHRGHKQNLFYSGNIDTFTPYTSPNSNRYNGYSSGISITNISDRSSIMHLNIEK